MSRRSLALTSFLGRPAVSLSRSRLRVELLEDRVNPAATLYLDFGAAFPVGGLQMTVDELRTGPINGPNLEGDGAPGVTITATSTVIFTPFANQVTFDYNGVGGVDAQDAIDLQNAVVSIVQRYYAPFDVTVVVASAASRADIAATLASTGTNDGYMLVAGITTDAGAIRPGLNGTSNGTDIGNNNANDNTGIAIVQNILAGTPATASDTEVAYTAAHEAAHDFGLEHTSETGAVNGELSDSDLIVGSADNTNRRNFVFVTRYPLIPDSPPPPAVVNYDRFADPNLLGARPGFGAYVTGTGADDIITVTRVSATQADVTVQAFRTGTNFGTAIDVPGLGAGVTSFTYSIDPSAGILIEAGFGLDRIILDPTLAVPVTVRGMSGAADELWMTGTNTVTAVYTPNATAPMGFDDRQAFGGTIVLSNGTSVTLDEFQTTGFARLDGFGSITFRSPGGADALSVSSPVAGQTRVGGTVSGATGVLPLIFLNVPTVTIDTGNADGVGANDTVTVNTLLAAGLTTLNVNTGAGSDRLVLNAGSYNLPGGGAFTFNAGTTGSDLDTVEANTDLDFILTDSLLSISSGGGAVVLNDVERAELTGGGSANVFDLSGWTGTASVNGAGNTDTLIRGNIASTWTVTGVDTGNVNGTVQFQSVENLTGGTLVDQFVIGALGQVSGAINGGGASDELVGPNAVNAWTITAPNAGSIVGVVNAFQSVENLTGGNQADTFTFNAGGSVTGFVEGDGGQDTLSFSALAGSQTVVLTATGGSDGFNGTVGVIGNGFRNINSITGSLAGATDSLAGLNSNSSWAHTGASGSYLDEPSGRTLTYSQFETLNGGLARDTFNIRQTAGNPLTANGNGGDDVFRISSNAGINDNGTLDGITQAVAVSGGGGTNTLTVSDFSAAAANANAAITGTQITGLAPAAINYNGITTLAVFGSDTAADTISVTSPSADLTLNTNGGGDTVRVRSLTLAATVSGGGGDDLVEVGNAIGSLVGIQAALTVDGGIGANDRLTATDSGTALGRAYTLTSSSLARQGAAGIGYANIDHLTLNGAAGANTYAVNSTGATSSTTIQDGNSGSQFTLNGDGLTGANAFFGNGGADDFVMNVTAAINAAAVLVSGGADADRLAANGTANNDAVILTLQNALGNGTVGGLGTTVGYDTLERFAFDGNGGSNSFRWADATNGAYGSALNPQDGVIFRPTGAASGEVSATGLFPFVSFANVGGDFGVNGDTDGSGDRDTLVALAASTNGQQSAFGELTTANGSDAITVSDTSVVITNAAAGGLRAVQLGYNGNAATFAALVVRSGNEAPPTGDTVVATPSNRLNIFLDGMDPKSGRGDRLSVTVNGGRSLAKSNDPANGPPHVRIVQDSDGASVGFIRFESIDGVGAYVAGSGVGVPATVQVFDSTSGKPRYAAIQPFGTFTGGVTVTTGDVNGDGIPDIVVGAAAGGSPRVAVFDGVDGSLVRSFYAYAPAFTGGVFVASGDTNGDGFAEILVGAGEGGGPHVRVLDGATGAELVTFFAYVPSFSGGIRVAAGDVNGDGFADIVLGAGTGGGPHVRVLDGQTLAQLHSFFAYAQGFTGGVFVSAGDLNGDGFADILTGAGNGAGPHVRAFDLKANGTVADFMVNDPHLPNAAAEVVLETGISVAVVDLDGDGVEDLLTGKGKGTRSTLRGFRVASQATPISPVVQTGLTPSLYKTGLGIPDGSGIFVGG